MQWNEWTTIASEYKLPTDELLRNISESFEKLNEIDQSHIRSVCYQALLEEKWVSSKRPYYRVHPNIISPILRTNLDKIPLSQLMMPKDLEAVHLTFPAGHQIGGLNNIQSILMGVVNDDCVDFAIDCIMSNGKSTVHSAHLRTTSDKSISEELYQLKHLQNLQEAAAYYNTDITAQTLLDTIANAVKICIVCKFIHDCEESELIQFDVLSKYKEQFVHADQLRKADLISKTIRRGKRGWNIGTSLLDYAGDYGFRSKEHGASGRELSSAHIRSGHLHIVRYGDGKKNIRVKFFRPTVVRPDLPFKHE